MAFLDSVNPLFWSAYAVCLLLPWMLVSVLAPCFWRKHCGKLLLLWTVAFTGFCITAFAGESHLVYSAKSGQAISLLVDLVALLHFLLFAYLPKVLLLFALLAIGGGIKLGGEFAGTPKWNLAVLTIGTVLSGFFGAFAIVALFIRPLLQGNAQRRYRAHSVLFFLVAAASSDGAFSFLPDLFLDPPLFLGFLEQIRPPWQLLATIFALSSSILAVYFLLDSLLFKKEEAFAQSPTRTTSLNNVCVIRRSTWLLLPALVAAVYLPDIWDTSGTGFEIYDRALHLAEMASHIAMLGITIVASLLNTRSHA